MAAAPPPGPNEVGKKPDGEFHVKTVYKRPQGTTQGLLQVSGIRAGHVQSAHSLYTVNGMATFSVWPHAFRLRLPCREPTYPGDVNPPPPADGGGNGGSNDGGKKGRPDWPSEEDLVKKYFPKRSGGQGGGSAGPSGSGPSGGAGGSGQSGGGPSGSSAGASGGDGATDRDKRPASPSSATSPSKRLGSNIATILRRDEERGFAPFMPHQSPWGSKRVRQPPASDKGYIVDKIEKSKYWLDVAMRVNNPHGFSRESIELIIDEALKRVSKLLRPLEEEMDVEPALPTAATIPTPPVSAPSARASAPIAATIPAPPSLPGTSSASAAASISAPPSLPGSSSASAAASIRSSASGTAASSAFATAQASPAGSASAVPFAATATPAPTWTYQQQYDVAIEFYLDRLGFELEGARGDQIRTAQVRTIIEQFRQRSVPRPNELLHLDPWAYLDQLLRSIRNNAMRAHVEVLNHRLAALDRITQTFGHYLLTERDDAVQDYINSLRRVSVALRQHPDFVEIYRRDWLFAQMLDDSLLDLGEARTAVRSEWLKKIRKMLELGMRLMRQQATTNYALPPPILPYLDIERDFLDEREGADVARRDFIRNQVAANRFEQIDGRTHGMGSEATDRARRITNFLAAILLHDNIITNRLRYQIDLLQNQLEHGGTSLRRSANITAFLNEAEEAMRQRGYFWNIYKQKPGAVRHKKSNATLILRDGARGGPAYPPEPVGNFTGPQVSYRVYRVDHVHQRALATPIYPIDDMNPAQMIVSVQLTPFAETHAVERILRTSPDLPYRTSIYPPIRAERFTLPNGDIELRIKFENLVAVIMLPLPFVPPSAENREILASAFFFGHGRAMLPPAVPGAVPTNAPSTTATTAPVLVLRPSTTTAPIRAKKTAAPVGLLMSALQLAPTTTTSTATTSSASSGLMSSASIAHALSTATLTGSSAGPSTSSTPTSFAAELDSMEKESKAKQGGVDPLIKVIEKIKAVIEKAKQEAEDKKNGKKDDKGDGKEK